MAATLIYDSFNRADNLSAVGNGWTPRPNDTSRAWGIESGKAYLSMVPLNPPHDTMLLQIVSYPESRGADGYIETKFTSVGERVGVIICSPDATFPTAETAGAGWMVYARIDNGVGSIYNYSGGQLQGTSTPGVEFEPGDVMRLLVYPSGTTSDNWRARLYKNGEQVADRSVTEPPTGDARMGLIAAYVDTTRFDVAAINTTIPPGAEDEYTAQPPIMEPVHANIRIDIYKPDGVTRITTVPRRRGVSWLDEVNAPGTGSFEIHLHDELLSKYPDLLDQFNIVKVFVNGEPRKAWVIEDVNPTRVTSGDDSANWVKVSGRGIMALLENAVIYPEYGLREFVSEDRRFSFASAEGVWYNATEWVTPVAVKWTDDTTPRKGRPVGWPDPDAAWLWSSSSNLNAPPGRNWFRTVFDIGGAPLEVIVYATADNQFNAFMDGELILSSGTNTGAFREIYEWHMTLAPGVHTFAAEVVNYGTRTTADDGNPAGFIFTMKGVGDDGGPTDTVIIRSAAANTKVKPYGRPPGWRGASILQQLIIEAQNRQVRSLMPITFSFDNTYDSAGLAWDDQQDRVAKVGTTDLYDLAQQIIELSLDLEIDTEFVLHAWRERGSDLSNSIRLVPSRNLTAAIGTVRAGKLRNQALLKFEGGWIELYTAVSKERYGRREVGLSVGTAASIEQTVLTGASAVREVAAPEKTIPVSYTSAVGPQPYVDYNLGDWITVPDVFTGMVKARLMSIAGSEQESGAISWDLDFYPDTPFDAVDGLVVPIGGTFLSTSGLYESQVLSDSPWAYYRFQEPGPDAGGDNIINDESGNGRFLTITGGHPLYSEPGPVDKSMLFSDTSAQYGYSPPTSTLTQGIVTMECWVKIVKAQDSTQGHYSPILTFGQGVDDLTHDKEILLSADNRIVWHISQPPNMDKTYLMSNAILALDRWYHVVCSIGPAGMKIYINGTLDIQRTDRNSANDFSPMYLFVRAAGAQGAGDPSHQNMTARIMIAEPAAYFQQLFDSRIKSHWDAAGYTP